MKNVSIGSLLRKARENSGLTQQQVANVLNIDRSTYTYYETGTTTPTAPMIIKISKIFNVPYTTFMNGFLDEGEQVADSAAKFDEGIARQRSNDLLDNISTYDLAKDEKQFLCYYRVLSKNKKKEIMDVVEKFCHDSL